MWNEGLDYIKQYQDKIVEVEINNDGLHLVGEFVDIGSTKSVVLLGGRCECLYYAYFYAKTYLEHNVNVLVIDSRAHGNSDGKINTVGIKESEDLKKWVELLHNKFGQEQIYIHGTCIGAATGIHMLAKEDHPKYVTKIVCDGLFHTYYETYYEHMKALGKPTKPFIDIIFFFYKHRAKIDTKNFGPINVIDKIDTDIMFISGEQDLYVSTTKAKELYEKCGSKHKEIHYLPYGNHSHLRYNQKDEYDKLVIDFISK